MTWWIIPIVLAAWAFDAVTDPDKRRAIAQFADWYIAEVGGGLARILLPEQTAELDRQESEGRRMLADRRQGYQPQSAPGADLTHAEVAAFVEHGTAVVPARPWIDPHAWSGVADLSNEELMGPRQAAPKPVSGHRID